MGLMSLLITPVASNELLIRLPREFIELFRRCPPLAVPLVTMDSRPRPFAIAANEPSRSSLFLSICGDSSDGRRTEVSVIFDFPLWGVSESGGRGGNWKAGVMDSLTEGSIVVCAREFRRRLSASSSIARTSCSMSRSSCVEGVIPRSWLREPDLVLEVGGWEPDLNFFDGCRDGLASVEDGGR
jgi:hypothetical protein